MTTTTQFVSIHPPTEVHTDSARQSPVPDSPLSSPPNTPLRLQQLLDDEDLSPTGPPPAAATATPKSTAPFDEPKGSNNNNIVAPFDLPPPPNLNNKNEQLVVNTAAHHDNDKPPLLLRPSWHHREEKKTEPLPFEDELVLDKGDNECLVSPEEVLTNPVDPTPLVTPDNNNTTTAELCTAPTDELGPAWLPRLDHEEEEEEIVPADESLLDFQKQDDHNKSREELDDDDKSQDAPADECLLDRNAERNELLLEPDRSTRQVCDSPDRSTMQVGDSSDHSQVGSNDSPYHSAARSNSPSSPSLSAFHSLDDTSHPPVVATSNHIGMALADPLVAMADATQELGSLMVTTMMKDVQNILLGMPENNSTEEKEQNQEEVVEVVVAEPKKEKNQMRWKEIVQDQVARTQTGGAAADVEEGDDDSSGDESSVFDSSFNDSNDSPARRMKKVAPPVEANTSKHYPENQKRWKETILSGLSQKISRSDPPADVMDAVEATRAMDMDSVKTPQVLKRNYHFHLDDVEPEKIVSSPLSEPPSLRKDMAGRHATSPLSEPPSLRKGGNSPDAPRVFFINDIQSSKIQSPTLVVRSPTQLQTPCQPDQAEEGQLPSLRKNWWKSDDEKTTETAVATTTSQPTKRPDPDAIYEDGSNTCPEILKCALQSVAQDFDGMSPRILKPVDSNDSPEPAQSVLSGSSAVSGSRQSRGSRDPEAITDGLPELLRPLNNDIGIPMGDVMISLLNDSDDRSWERRVHEAIWRCRTMRRNCDTTWLRDQFSRQDGQPARGRSSVRVDADDARVLGGITSVSASQVAAVQHLKYDELDDALALYEDIIDRYFTFSEDHVKNISDPTSQQTLTRFRPHIGSALHNIGIINMLRGDFDQAFKFLDRAVSNRTNDLGAGHPDHLASVCRRAVCQFARENFEAAGRDLQNALTLARGNLETLPDRRLCAEILNNLACISYMCNFHTKPTALLRESLEMQLSVSDDSLYCGSKFSCHSSALNISVTKANIGFLALVSRDTPKAIPLLQSAFREQCLLLRGAHVTLISTMDHLSVAHLLAGNNVKSVQVLRRMFHMQVDEFGPSDPRCQMTKYRIEMVEDEEASDRVQSALQAIPNLESQVGKKSVSLFKALKKTARPRRRKSGRWTKLNDV